MDIVSRYRQVYGLGEEVGQSEVDRHCELEARLTKGILSSTPDGRWQVVSDAYTQLYRSRFSVNERIAAVCGRAGLAYKSSHTVGRHAFATNALNAGVSVRVAMDAGGWKSSTIFLETYAHSVEAGRVVMDRFNAIHYADQF